MSPEKRKNLDSQLETLFAMAGDELNSFHIRESAYNLLKCFVVHLNERTIYSDMELLALNQLVDQVSIELFKSSTV